MPIDFQCPQCGKRLRTGDETAGRQARCPECQAVMTVPDASERGAVSPSASTPAPRTPPAFHDPNPYAAGSTSASAAPSVGAGEIRPTIIDFGDVFATTWEAFKRNMGMCIGIVIVALVIQNVVNSTPQFVLYVAEDAGAPAIAIAAIYIMSIALIIAVSAFFSSGITNAMLKLARGQATEFGDMFSGGPWFVPILLVTLLGGLLFVLGCFLLFVPGVIVALLFSQCYALIVDRNLGVTESMTQSIEITRGNRWTLLGLLIVAWLLLVASICTCVGYFFALPFFSLMYAVAYLRMTGQPTVMEAVDRTAAY